MDYQNEHAVSTIFNTHVTDLNGDGLDDVIVAGWAAEPAGYSASVNSNIPLKILIQQPNGSLLDKTDQLVGIGKNMILGAQRIIVEDFDSNGKPDIFLGGFQDIPSHPAPSVIFWNEGSSFTRADFSESVWAHAACAGDLRGVGRKDLIMGAEGARLNSIYTNNGNRSFTLDPTLISKYISAGGACSVMKDPFTGNIGIITTNYVGFNGFSGVVHIFDSQLKFIKSVGIPSSEEAGVAYNLVHDLVNIIQMDLNGDGLLDLVLTDNGNFRLSKPTGAFIALINQGNFSFSNQTSTFFPSQTNDSIFGYFTRALNLGGLQTIFVANEKFFWQLSGNKFQKHLASQITDATGTYKLTTAYQASDGSLKLLLLDSSKFPNHTFYTKPLQ
jgi:FG-GAP-like repeat